MRSATWRAIGTTVQVLVTEDAVMDDAAALLRDGLQALDEACSRFRADSELCRLQPGRQPVSPALAGAVRAALQAAEQTGGLVDPTLGPALVAAGYDRTYADLPSDGPAAVVLPQRVDWREIRCGEADLYLPATVLLDLGATAKAWAADEAASRVAAELGTGVLVNLGGDIAVAGRAPDGGWCVDTAGEPVSVSGGGLATSSTVQRTWTRGGRRQHHVLDPRTSRPARTPWTTVTVAAASCLEANTASTAAVVLGGAAPAWLAARGLPARLVDATGAVVRTAGWPQEEGAA